MIPVTKSYLPDREKFNQYVDKIYEKGWLTNNGELVRELEQKLQDYLGVEHLILVANGSLALQIAYKALGLSGEVITTPFSFVATSSTLAWEGLIPVFSDIDPDTFNINPSEIEKKISSRTSAIVPVHVFGVPCDIETVQAIAAKHNLKVIYDAAHAYGVKYKGQSVLNYGDISTLSFHATKLFHTIEGGAIITNDSVLAEKVRLLINFGITGPTTIETLGINAKMNEFEAAMGLCVLDDIEYIAESRQEIWDRYIKRLDGVVQFQKVASVVKNNFAYFPVLFQSENELKKVQYKLNESNIYPRRYFYPSLDSLNYLDNGSECENSKSIASRVMCLPIYPGLEKKVQDEIIEIIKINING